MKIFSTGEELRELRQSLALSLAELAEMSGVSKGSIGNYETGIRGLGRKSMLSIESALVKRLPAKMQVFADTAAEPGVEYRMSPPMHLLSARERATQYAVNAFDSAQSAGKAGQFETLMLHIVGVVSHDESYAWHRAEIDNLIDRHFK